MSRSLLDQIENLHFAPPWTAIDAYTQSFVGSSPF